MTTLPTGSLFVWHDKLPQCSALARQVAETRGGTSTGYLVEIARILDRDAGARAILLHAPRPGLVAQLLSGQTARQAITAWCEDARALVGVLRAHRAACLLLDVSLAEKHSAAMAAALGLKTLPPGCGIEAARDDMQMFLAECAFRNAPEASGLLDYLEAGTHQVSPDPGLDVPDIDAAFAALRRTIKTQQARIRQESIEQQGLRDDRRRALEHLQGQKAQIAALQAEIDRILGSRSIRLTEPLRRASAALKALARG